MMALIKKFLLTFVVGFFLYSCGGSAPILKLSSDAPIRENPDDLHPTFEVFEGQSIDIAQYLIAFDAEDDLTADQIRITSGAVDVRKPGLYPVVFQVTDSSGQICELTVQVEVRPLYSLSRTPPTIILLDELGNDSSDPISIKRGEEYNEPGFRLTDDIDQEINPDNVSITYYRGIEMTEANRVEKVDSSLGGMFTALYVVLDSSGNSSRVSRYIYVTNIGDAPVITLQKFGGLSLFESDDFSRLKLQCNVQPYLEPGLAQVTDKEDGNIPTHQVSIVGMPENAGPGQYEVIYQVTDSSGNSAIAIRTVTLVDDISPVLSFIQDPLDRKVYLKQGQFYADPRLSIEDKGDINLSWSDVDYLLFRLGHGTQRVAVTSLPAVEDRPGDLYEVDYELSDASGNRSLTVTREVQIVDGKSPVIEFKPGTETITLIKGDAWVEPGVTVYDPIDDPAATETVSVEQPEGAPLSVTAYRLPGPYNPWGADPLPVSPNDTAVPALYRGHFETDTSELKIDRPGTYRIRYTAYDNAEKSVPADWPDRIDNRSEKVRVVHVLGTPRWSEVERVYYRSQSDGNFALNWREVPGADGYKITRASNIAGPYLPVGTTSGGELCSYLDHAGEGTFFYKINATSKGRDGETSEPMTFINLSGAVNGITVTQGLTNRIEISWAAKSGADGYRIYAMPKISYANSVHDDIFNYQIAEVGAVTTHLYQKTRSERDPNAMVAADMKISAPPGYVYFWVEAFADPTLYGLTTGTQWAGNSLSAEPAVGFRDADTDEWISICMRMLYDLSAPLSFNATPWSDYWSAKAADTEQIRLGFDLLPSSVPGSIPGAFVSGPNVLIKSQGGGRVIREAVRTKESHLDELTGKDYVFSRWWYDNPASGDHVVIQGWRRDYEDFDGRKNQIYVKLIVEGLYPGTFMIDFANSDSGDEKAGGSCVNSGYFKVDRVSDSTWNPTTVTFNSAKHFTW